MIMSKESLVLIAMVVGVVGYTVERKNICMDVVDQMSNTETRHVVDLALLTNRIVASEIQTTVEVASFDGEIVEKID